MSFEETLAVLQGWLGRELEVALLSSVGEAEMIATMAGEVVAVSDLSGAGERDGTVYFQLGGVGASRFLLGPEAFPAAEWHDEERTVLAVDSGACGCWSTGSLSAGLSGRPEEGHRP